jgi:hypothetical protein
MDSHRFWKWKPVMAGVKLAITADLHLPITRLERLGQLTGEMAEFAPDAVIVAGDLAESLADLERCLALFRQSFSCPVLVIPGNHDLWVRRTNDSRQLWEEGLPQTVARAGCCWLEGRSFLVPGPVQGSVGIVGTIAWYDYSAADPSVQASALAFAQQKYNYNPDALLIDWEWSDPEFAERVAGPFLQSLDALEDNPGVGPVVVVTHVPIVEGQLCRQPDNPVWAFSNAYLGNWTLGHKVLARSKVTHIISGHTHIGQRCLVAREKDPAVEAHVLACDYEKPVWLGLTFSDPPSCNYTVHAPEP